MDTTTLSANRLYKDRLNKMIFNDKKELLNLYNAINGTHYDNPALLTITTLENAIYMTMANDLSFIIDMRLALYEQQSTVNPRACLKKAFCKMCVTICGNDFSDTLYWTKSVKYHYRPEVLCQNSKTTYNFI